MLEFSGIAQSVELNGLVVPIARNSIAGSDITLICSYVLNPTETLNDIKWRKGDNEFFRYMPPAQDYASPWQSPPTESPSNAWPISSILVDVSLCLI